MVTSGCALANACVVGALVRLPAGTSLPSKTVVYSSANASHVLPRDEAQVRAMLILHPFGYAAVSLTTMLRQLVASRTKAVDQELDLLHREFKRSVHLSR